MENIKQNNIAFNKDLPSLANEINKEAIIKSAATKVGVLKKYPTSSCWVLWIALMGYCSMECSGNSNPDCWWNCNAAFSLTVGVCFLLAD